MDLKDALQAARDHLDVTWLVVTPREGTRIDVGEEFDVQMAIRNTFVGSGTVPGFKDIELLIEETAFARPVGEGTVRVDARLGPGESAHPVVRFRALHADPAGKDGPRELIAGVRVRARLDIEPLLDVETDRKLVRIQVHGDPESR